MTASEQETAPLDARNAPVIDDSYPDASFEMRRGWEAAIAAVLALPAATPSPDAADPSWVGKMGNLDD